MSWEPWKWGSPVVEKDRDPVAEERKRDEFLGDEEKATQGVVVDFGQEQEEQV